MKHLRMWLMLATSLLFTLMVIAPIHAHDDSNAPIVSVQFKNYKAGMSFIRSLGLDVAGVDIDENVIDFFLEDIRTLEKIEKSGLEFTILNVNSKHLSRPDPKFKNPTNITEIFTKFAQDYPAIAKLHVIGKSTENRPIYGLKISDNVEESEAEEPAVLFNALHHAREVMTPEVIIDIAEYLLSKYDSDPKVMNWVDNNEIWLVPMVNPDGSAKVWGGSSMWRKNTRGGYGVDLNRNYPYRWGGCSGSSGMTFSDTYRGPSVASEPETQTMMGLVKNIHPVFNISYHSYSELVIYPFGCQGSYAHNRQLVQSVSDKLASLLVKDNNSGNYKSGTGWELLYGVDGDDASWMYQDYATISFVVELNSTSAGFHPPYSLRDPTVNKQRAGWMYLLDSLNTSGIRGYVSSILDPENFETATVHVKGSGNQVFEETFKVKHDGTFHAIVHPGTYVVTLSDNSIGTHSKEVLVGAERIEIKF